MSDTTLQLCSYIAPAKLLRAMLIQVFYNIRSERQLMEQLQYNLLFRWFIGLAMDDEVWVPTVFMKNRERPIKHDAVIEFFNEVVAIVQKKCLLSGERASELASIAAAANRDSRSAPRELQELAGTDR